MKYLEHICKSSCKSSILLLKRNKGSKPALTAPCQVIATLALPDAKCMFQALNVSEKLWTCERILFMKVLLTKGWLFFIADLLLVEKSHLYLESIHQDQAEWGLDQPSLVETIPASGRGVGTRWSVRSLQPKPFYESMINTVVYPIGYEKKNNNKTTKQN